MANSTDDVVAHISTVRPYGSSAGATPDSRADIQVWDFDDDTTEYAYLDGRMRNWDGSTSVQVRFAWTASTDNNSAHQVRWVIEFWHLADGGDDVDSGWAGSGEQGVSSNVAATCGDPIYAEIEFSSAQMDSVADGDLFRLRIYRYTSHEDDDCSGDAEVWADSFEIVAA